MEDADDRGNRLLDLLPAADRRRLLDHMEVVELDLRQPVYEPGKPIEYVYFPLTTVISMLAVMDDGQAVEVATMGNEGMAGLPVFLGATSSPDRAFARVPGRALRMSAGEFRELATAPARSRGCSATPRRSLSSWPRGRPATACTAPTSVWPAGCC
jgi:CRP-like cAMP-binding protein